MFHHLYHTNIKYIYIYFLVTRCKDLKFLLLIWLWRTMTSNSIFLSCPSWFEKYFNPFSVFPHLRKKIVGSCLNFFSSFVRFDWCCIWYFCLLFGVLHISYIYCLKYFLSIHKKNKKLLSWWAVTLCLLFNFIQNVVLTSIRIVIIRWMCAAII